MAQPNVVAFPPLSRRGPGGPYVARLAVSEFRCYAQASLEADHRPVVLSGPNGAGKTNLLEALSFLTPGRGLRQARLSEIDRREPGLASEAASETVGPWAVSVRLDGPDGECEIGTGRDAAAEENARERRLLRIDGSPQRGLSGLAERLALLWLTPQMDGLFLDSRSARRRFLDRLAASFDPGHASRLNAYEQAQSERLRLLRGEMPGEPRVGEVRTGDPAWLSALEQQVAEHGIALAAARLDLVQRLNQVLAEADGAFPRPDLAILGDVETWLADMPALAAEDRLRQRLAEGRSLDAEAGRSLTGAHRSDLYVRFAATHMPAADCSTGEQKALLIAILLGQARLMAAERGRTPLLLLDEVAAHLDENRRRALFETLLELGVQAWLTGTDRSLFAGFGDRAQFFTVAEARITRN